MLTVVSGLVAGLVAFVAARVLTGLGEGVFYSNDRTLIMNHTPVAKRTLGLGVVIAGLSIGLTVGIIFTPLLIGWGTSLGMGGEAWRMPFFVFAAFTFVVVAIAFTFFRAKLGGAMRLGPPFLRLLALLRAHLRRDRRAVPAGRDAALAGVADRDRRHASSRWSTSRSSCAASSESGRGPALLNRNIWLVYIAYIAILWNLWFFSFWSVQIVKEAAQSSLLAAALTAAFNAGAGILGFPAGGWLADRAVRTGRSRKTLALICTGVYSVLVLIFGWSVSGGEQAVARAARAAAVHLRAVLQRAAADRAGHDRRHGAGERARRRPSGCSTWSPRSAPCPARSSAASCATRPAAGRPGVYVAAGIMIVSFFLYLMVREAPAHHEDPIPA